MTTLHLDHVFETAVKIEAHLLGASERIAKLLVDALEVATDDGDANVAQEANNPS